MSTMRPLTFAVSLSLAIGGCKKGNSEQAPRINAATPADWGRSFCALLRANQTDRLGELAPWRDRVDECNNMTRLNECKKAGWRIGSPCTVVPEGKTYPQCDEQKLKDGWRELAEAFAKSDSTCRVDSPASGQPDEIDMSLFGVRETVLLEKTGSGTWQVSRKRFFLPDVQKAAIDESLK